MANFYGQFIGFGAGGVAAGFVFQGAIEGYSLGGTNVSAGTIDVIDKYSFSADQNATDVGNLTVSKGGAPGTHSPTYGYVGGGGTGTGANSGRVNVIERLAFVSGGKSVAQTAVLLNSKTIGASASEETFGYHMGGYAPSNTNIIQKHSMVADTDATDVGDLSENKARASGASSTTHGYAMGSYGPSSNVIDKVSFASGSVSGNVAQLTVARGSSGASSTTHGYAFGGYAGHPSNYQDEIDKFSFASEGAGSDVGNTTLTGGWGSSTSSTASGYTFGGDNRARVIDKVSFTSDGNATDVGDTTVHKSNMGSQGWNY